MSDEPRETGRRAVDGLDWAVRGAAEPALAVPPESQPPSRPRRSWIIPLTAAASAIAGGLVAGTVVGFVMRGDGASSAEVAPPPQGSGQIVVQLSSAVSDVATKGRLSVVKIESQRKLASGVIETDVGSGLILDDQGHIATNAHVIIGTESLKVILADGSERPAFLVGHDFPFTDVAVLQVGPGGLASVEPGNSDQLALGQTLVAIGNPLVEFQGSVTVGVVSGLRRSRIFDAVRYDDLIQTDAAINSGNSGGALFDLAGRFVGMPTAVLRQTRGGLPVEGIGFALPSNRVIAVARAIIAANGAPPRPSLGIEHSDLAFDGSPRPPRNAPTQGALVITVAAGGPGAEAGIQPGDVITQLGDVAINKDRPLLNGLLDHQPGETVKVVLSRAGRIIETEVKLVKRG